MENSNRNSENDFVNFFKGLDESYQQYLINEMKKKPPDHQPELKADMAESEGGPKYRQLSLKLKRGKNNGFS